ncbi:MAG: DUF5698 domain-containing protein [Candidatus Hodarchaeota archaeon]
MIKLFFTGLIEIFLGAIDFKLTQRDRKILSSMTTIIGVFIWYFVVRTIVSDLANIPLVVSYALGCGLGCYLGLVLDDYIEKELFGMIPKKGRKIKRGKIIVRRQKN